MELLGNGNGPLPAVAELTVKHTAEPLEEADNNTAVHIVHFIELLKPFLIGF